MGSFYTNVTLRGPAQDEALEAMRGRKAFVSPRVNEYVVVYDEECDEQGPALFELSASLSRRLGCIAFAVLNHDDDVLWIHVSQNGDLLDEYKSNPAVLDDSNPASPDDKARPEGGAAALWVGLFGRGDPERVESILRSEEYVFEFERHKALLTELGLPLESCGWGFDYIQKEPSKTPFVSSGLKKTF